MKPDNLIIHYSDDRMAHCIFELDGITCRFICACDSREQAEHYLSFYKDCLARGISII